MTNEAKWLRKKMSLLSKKIIIQRRQLKSVAIMISLCCLQLLYTSITKLIYLSLQQQLTHHFLVAKLLCNQSISVCMYFYIIFSTQNSVISTSSNALFLIARLFYRLYPSVSTFASLFNSKNKASRLFFMLNFERQILLFIQALPILNSIVLVYSPKHFIFYH